MTAPLVELVGIAKRFSGVQALRGVALRVEAGECVAVVGENGAGKSTLMRILAGVHTPDAGEVRINGAPVRLTGVRDAMRHGIALVHQELNLVESLCVSANVMLGREPQRGGFLQEVALRAKAARALALVGYEGSPDALISTLPVSRRQLVEIAKAVSAQAKILILDEPTSALTSAETARLLALIRRLCAQGSAVLLVSHRLEEVLEIADRVEVLRDGLNTDSIVLRDRMKNADHAPSPNPAAVEETAALPERAALRLRIVRAMIGRDLPARVRRSTAPDQIRLEVRGLRTRAHPTVACSLTLRAGEITAIAGLVGAGRTELLETIFGAAPAAVGAPAATITIDGVTLRAGAPSASVAAGLALVPEDRARHGLLLPESVRANLSLAALRSFAHGGFVRRRDESTSAHALMASLRIRAMSADVPAQTLSGGNQQKVVFGKWLACAPDVLLLDEPSRGVDVGAREEIHAEIRALADAGAAVLFASSDLEEVLLLADRVLVMDDGAIVGDLAAIDATEERLMRMATGEGRSAA